MLNRIRFPSWTLPLIFVLVLVLALAPWIPDLGFYQDDWHAVFNASAYGPENLSILYSYDSRPFSAWPYLLAIPIIGYDPLLWHIQLLLLRILTVIVFWAFLQAIWPDNKLQVAWVTILFSVYPFFKLQPLSVAYTQHWTSYLLFGFSMLFMALAVQRKKWFWLFSGLAIATEIAHLLTVEYFAGLELLRPVVLWVLFIPKQPNRWKRLGKALLYWLPYAAVLGLFALWRVVIYQPPVQDINPPTLLTNLFSSPLSALFHLITTAFQDTMIILFQAWGEVFSPDFFNLRTPAAVFGFLIAIALIILLYVYFNRTDIAETGESSQNWAHQALLLGVFALVLGPLPAWINDLEIFNKNPLWNDRLGMAAMFGAALIVVSLLEILISNPRYRLGVFVVLIGLSAAWHLRSTNEFRWSWIKQSRFYQQLSWRAPTIEPRTTILSDGEIFPFMGYYPTSFAINTFYPQQSQPPEVDFWYAGLYKSFQNSLNRLFSGVPIRFSKYSSEFTADSLDSLVIYYAPEAGQCLWILRPEDQDLPGLPEITRQSLALSDIKRISPQDSVSQTVASQIVDIRPQNTWCYYFLKADLARQEEDYERIRQLWQEAREGGLNPESGVELLPFVEGFAYGQDWENAFRLTRQANELTDELSPALCRTWLTIYNQSPSSEELEQIIQEVDQLLQCN